jgi:lipooligosaccharide transport system permease protein
VVSLALPRLVAARRAGSVVERNAATLRTTYWVVMATGFLEPVLYLFSIGLGVGALVGDLRLADGRVVGYAAFVAPAMLASSAMTGALAETTFNFYGKMKWQRLYEGILATPVRPIEVAVGELAWAMLRGAAYALVFLAVMVAMHLTTAAYALVALLAAVLTGFAFGAVGMALATFFRSWQDFDLVATGQFALFLFSGTFVPAEGYPVALRGLVAVTPLYRSVDLIRHITTGGWAWVQLADVAYLVLLLVGGLWLAGRRMERLLCK